METEKKSNGEFFGLIVIILILIIGGIYIWHSEYQSIVNKKQPLVTPNTSQTIK
jgi:uncharacterized protein YxeA